GRSFHRPRRHFVESPSVGAARRVRRAQCGGAHPGLDGDSHPAAGGRDLESLVAARRPVHQAPAVPGALGPDLLGGGWRRAAGRSMDSRGRISGGRAGAAHVAADRSRASVYARAGGSVPVHLSERWTNPPPPSSPSREAPARCRALLQGAALISTPNAPAFFVVAHVALTLVRSTPHSANRSAAVPSFDGCSSISIKPEPGAIATTLLLIPNTP